MTIPKIFVSSTIRDLKHVREVIRKIIQDIACEPCLSEFGDVIFDPQDGVIQSCINSVSRSDIYLIIVSKRYGSAATTAKKSNKLDFWKRYTSVTEEEFNTAKKNNLPIYALVDKEIIHDYRRFTKRRGSKREIYDTVDSINVFHLLDRIKNDSKIPVEEFEKLEATEKWLKEQWAGWFKNLIDKSKYLSADSSEKTDRYKEYVDAHAAFGDLYDLIEKKIEANKNKGKDIVIDLKLISVAMLYSKSWLLSSLPKLLEKPKVKIKISSVIVQTDHLASLNLYDYVEDWVETSNSNILKLKKFIESDLAKYKNKLEFKLVFYKNIPHWHGWLLDDESLFLGRTNWGPTSSSKLSLQVGQNKYRYFNNSTKGGRERIDLFKNWFGFYYSYPFELGYNPVLIDKR